LLAGPQVDAEVVETLAHLGDPVLLVVSVSIFGGLASFVEVFGRILFASVRQDFLLGVVFGDFEESGADSLQAAARVGVEGFLAFHVRDLQIAMSVFLFEVEFYLLLDVLLGDQSAIFIDEVDGLVIVHNDTLAVGLLDDDCVVLKHLHSVFPVSKGVLDLLGQLLVTRNVKRGFDTVPVVDVSELLLLVVHHLTGVRLEMCDGRFVCEDPHTLSSV